VRDDPRGARLMLLGCHWGQAHRAFMFIRESYLFGGHVVLVLGPGEERPYLGLVEIMRLDVSIYRPSDDRLWLTDVPDAPPLLRCGPSSGRFPS